MTTLVGIDGLEAHLRLAGGERLTPPSAPTTTAELDLPARLHQAQTELSARFDDVWTLQAFVR